MYYIIGRRERSDRLYYIYNYNNDAMDDDNEYFTRDIDAIRSYSFVGVFRSRDILVGFEYAVFFFETESPIFF